MMQVLPHGSVPGMRGRTWYSLAPLLRLPRARLVPCDPPTLQRRQRAEVGGIGGTYVDTTTPG